MRTRWDFGDRVRLVRNVRNDGTFPGKETGTLLIERGSIGHVVNVGTFLIDQIIYSVHFIDADVVVGCREEELIGANDAWIPSLFETRQRVASRIPLVLRGEVLVAAGGSGEVMKVMRDAPGGVAYHVHFDDLKGRPLQVPESALLACTERGHA